MKHFNIPLSSISINLLTIVLLLLFSLTSKAQEVGFVLIKSKPTNAKVFINGKNTNEQTTFQKQLPAGKYTYTLKLDNYNDKKGDFVIEPNTTKRLELELIPNFGSISITSNPTVSKVYLNDSLIGTTPLVKHKIPSGIHQIKVEKKEFKAIQTTINVNDADTIHKSIDLNADFGTVGILAEPNAEIWIDGEKKGTKFFSGRIQEGSHLIEARKESYKSKKLTIYVERGEETKHNIKLDPILGNISIIVNPPEAKVYLDDEFIGTSPLIKNDILIGDHKIKIEKENLRTEVFSIMVEPGKTSEVKVSLVEKPKKLKPLKSIDDYKDDLKLITWEEFYNEPKEKLINGDKTIILSTIAAGIGILILAETGDASYTLIAIPGFLSGIFWDVFEGKSPKNQRKIDNINKKRKTEAKVAAKIKAKEHNAPILDDLKDKLDQANKEIKQQNEEIKKKNAELENKRHIEYSIGSEKVVVVE